MVGSAVTSEAAPAGPSSRSAAAVFMGPGTILAMLLVVAASLVGTWLRAHVEPVAMAITVVLGIVYAAIGGIGLTVAERRGDRRALVTRVGLLVVLAALVVPASKGEAWFMPLPVITVSILFLPPVWMRASVAFLGALVVASCFRSPRASFIAGELASHGSAVAFVVVFSHMAKRQHEARARIEELAGELAAANQRLREHAAQAHDLATAKERNRIAREIHDGLGHYLTVVFVQLEAADKLFAKDPARALVAIDKAKQLTHEGLDEVRRAVTVLRETGPASRTLLESLEELATGARASGLDARVVVHGEPRALAEPTAFTLYRAAQEALTNVSRHAKARNVTVEVEFAVPSGVALRVEDDGIGSDRPDGGFGLVGLRERAELVGGEVAIRTARGQGFALELRVPG